MTALLTILCAVLLIVALRAFYVVGTLKTQINALQGKLDAHDLHKKEIDKITRIIKSYDKATVGFINALLKKGGFTKERTEWESAKNNLKKWRETKT